jgi:hypothetical protein
LCNAYLGSRTLDVGGVQDGRLYLCGVDRVDPGL